MQRGEGDLIGMILFGVVMTLAILAAVFGAATDLVIRLFS